jgi:hypothetical protein
VGMLGVQVGVTVALELFCLGVAQVILVLPGAVSPCLMVDRPGQIYIVGLHLVHSREGWSAGGLNGAGPGGDHLKRHLCGY